jgi:phosphoadenylyl-sulfate reductase (thioredoxin)
MSDTLVDLVDSLDKEELGQRGRSMEDWPAPEILTWAADRFPTRITFATGLGPEGCVLIDLIGRYALPIDVFTLDTGLLFPETYTLWRRLEQRYGIVIRRVQPRLNVEEQAAQYGPRLWERHPDHCCEMRKVTPLQGALAGFDAWITAIRRDQTAARADALVVEWDAKFQLAKVNPLVRWTKNDVWAHLLRHEVPYNPLHDHSYPSIGCVPCTGPVQPGEDPRAGRWRGIVKTECGLHGPVIPVAPLAPGS